jgi:hypothetical protein
MFGKKYGAKARINAGQLCRQPAMHNGRCRLQGGKSTGAKTQEGLWKIKKAVTKHALYSKEALIDLAEDRQLVKESKSALLCLRK